jgi:Predicted dehydrogenases and related proteins
MEKFIFSVIGLEHAHIYGMCQSLIRAGAEFKSVYDSDPLKIQAFLKQFPQSITAKSEEEILSDKSVKLITSAAVTSERCALGLRVMDSGKDYFTDKGPFTTLEQLKLAREKVKETNRKYMVCYSERLQNESAMYAGELIQRGEIGKVVQVIGLGPHRLSAKTRPEWFFQKKKYGGILADIGSHQFEQFLYYTGSKDAQVLSARVDNFNNPDYPELEDFGEVNLIGDSGASGYIRIDWLTPAGLPVWGDGKTVILGTEGYIELRKYINVTVNGSGGNHIYLVNGKGEQYINATGKIGEPFFGKLIEDCINRTETAMTQEHAFKAAELCLIAQNSADKRKENISI